MTSNDIIRMAREAECSETLGADAFMFTLEELERFFQSAFAAGAAAERTACAQVCEELIAWDEDDPGSSAAAAIRARGQA